MRRIHSRFNTRLRDDRTSKRAGPPSGARCTAVVRVLALLAGLLLLALPPPVQAGPWPREKGGVFLSFGGQYEISRLDGTARNYATLYGEYGLTEKLTLGVDAGGDNGQPEKAMVFLRLPVFTGDRKMLYAAELGVGQVDNQMALRPGFTLGRGFSLRDNNGWMTLDTRGVLFAGNHDPMIEADFTIGYAPTKRLKLIAQLQTGMTFGQSPYVKFVPSLVFEQKPGQHMEFGVIAGIRDDTAYGFKIGFWRSF